jgi:hypothetical protein
LRVQVGREPEILVVLGPAVAVAAAAGAECVPGQPGPQEHGSVLVGAERHQHGLPRVLDERDGQLVRYPGDVAELLAGARIQALRARAVVPQPHRGELQRPTAGDQLQVRDDARLPGDQSWLYKF